MSQIQGCRLQRSGLRPANFSATGGRHTGLTIKTSGRSVTVQLSWPQQAHPENLTSRETPAAPDPPSCAAV